MSTVDAERRRAHLERVKGLSETLGVADASAAAMRIELQEAIREAERDGVPQVALADAAGLSRQRIGQIVG